MKYEKSCGAVIFRKGETGWFVGFTQENGQKTYFAVYLSDESREISGSDAKAVALALLE